MEQDNSYVKYQLTTTLLKLLKDHSLKEISISLLCEEAYVGRASFYRNYKSKEDILIEYDHQLIKEWGKEFEANPNSTHETLIPSLIGHYSKYREFYMILYRENLSEIILNTILSTMELKKKENNIEAYCIAFVGYGIFGIINEWISRGMQESAEQIAILTKISNTQNN